MHFERLLLSLALLSCVAVQASGGYSSPSSSSSSSSARLSAAFSPPPPFPYLRHSLTTPLLHRSTSQSAPSTHPSADPDEQSPTPSPALPPPAQQQAAYPVPSSRRSLLSFAPPLLAALTVAAGGAPQPASARASALTRGLVNLVRVREGTDLLLSRLREGKLSGFQTAIKLLLLDTDLRNSARDAAIGLGDLGLVGRVSMAGSIGETVFFRLAQVVEWDGWDKLDRDVGEQFTRMTPEKVAFATRGLTSVKFEVARLLALFPREEVAEAERLYREIFVQGNGVAPTGGGGGEPSEQNGFISF